MRIALLLIRGCVSQQPLSSGRPPQFSDAPAMSGLVLEAMQGLAWGSLKPAAAFWLQ